MKTEANIRNLSNELKDLGFNEEQADKILEWVDTIPIRNYAGEEVKVELKKGTVRVNEHLVNSEDLSFNKLPHDLALYYAWDNGMLHNPFDLPDNIILHNPFTGKAINKDGTPAKMGNSTKIITNPFNMKIISKIEYKDDKPYKKWSVNSNNEWVEGKFD